jgi:hypothetical protein
VPHSKAKRRQFVDAGFGATSDATPKVLERPDSVSRFRRLRSALTSAADWQRTLRSFSKALVMMRSSSAGTSGLRRTGATGARSRMALNQCRSVAAEGQRSSAHLIENCAE